MDGFSYVDIFATKGAEYLLVIAYLGILIVFLRSLSSREKGKASHEDHRTP